MKKFLISSSIAGALLLGGTVGAFAASNSKTLEVFFNIKDIKINQVSKMPKDTKPFVHEGTTYVPLRFISEQLGSPVEWDSKTQTIYIGETTDKAAYYPGRDMEYMNYQRSDSFPGNESKYSFGKNSISDNIGNEYSNYITLGVSDIRNDSVWTLIEFPLNGNFKTFNANLGLTAKYKSTTSTVALEVYLDEKLEKTYSLSSGVFPEEITVDVKHANKIGFKLVKTSKGGSEAEVGLFEPKFYK